MRADSAPTVASDVVVFVSDSDGNEKLYRTSPAGGAEIRLTKTGSPEKHPALSPDGARLAFVRGFGLTRLYLAAADATGAQRPDPTYGHDGTLEVSAVAALARPRAAGRGVRDPAAGAGAEPVAMP